MTSTSLYSETNSSESAIFEILKSDTRIQIQLNDQLGLVNDFADNRALSRQVRDRASVDQ